MPGLGHDITDVDAQRFRIADRARDFSDGQVRDHRGVERSRSDDDQICSGERFESALWRIDVGRIEIEPGYEPEWQPWPIPKPKDGLRIALRPL